MQPVGPIPPKPRPVPDRFFLPPQQEVEIQETWPQVKMGEEKEKTWWEKIKRFFRSV